MEIHRLLSIKTMTKGNHDLGYQYYQITAADNDGKFYLMTVGCKLIHQTSCEKAFQRLVMVPAPSNEELEQMQQDANKSQILN